MTQLHNQNYNWYDSQMEQNPNPTRVPESSSYNDRVKAPGALASAFWLLVVVGGIAWGLSLVPGLLSATLKIIAGSVGFFIGLYVTGIALKTLFKFVTQGPSTVSEETNHRRSAENE